VQLTAAVFAFGFLRQEKVLRRVLTLKVLPETGTDYLSVEHLLSLVEKRGEQVHPFPYWLSCVVRIDDQARAKLKLNTSHNLVDLLSSAIPFMKTRSVQRDAEQAAKRAGIEGLFIEVSAMASKVVSLSMSLLLDAPTLETLDARTQAARSAFAAAGNSELLLGAGAGHVSSNALPEEGEQHRRDRSTRLIGTCGSPIARWARSTNLGSHRAAAATSCGLTQERADSGGE
jgi:hypothetical protein